MESQISNNTVFLSGRIISEPIFSHQVYGEGFYETYLEVPRLSDQTDKIPITVSERLMSEGDFEIGSYISILGQFRSYNKLFDGKSKLMLTVFVRELIDDDNERNPNQIEIVGYICKEPIFRTTPFKREICDILVAVNRAYNKSDYIPCITWGRNARFASNLSIGAKIVLSGRIQSREYQKTLDDGNVEVRVAFEISVSRLNLADGEEEAEENY